MVIDYPKVVLQTSVTLFQLSESMATMTRTKENLVKTRDSVGADIFLFYLFVKQFNYQM